MRVELKAARCLQNQGCLRNDAMLVCKISSLKRSVSLDSNLVLEKAKRERWLGQIWVRRATDGDLARGVSHASCRLQYEVARPLRFTFGPMLVTDGHSNPHAERVPRDKQANGQTIPEVSWRSVCKIACKKIDFALLIISESNTYLSFVFQALDLVRQWPVFSPPNYCMHQKFKLSRLP